MSRTVLASGSITIIKATDVDSCVPYYFQTPQSSPPSQPTDDTALPSGWSDTEPEYDASTVVYIVWQVIYSDGSIKYSDVSLMSSYTAAN